VITNHILRVLIWMPVVAWVGLRLGVWIGG